MGEHHNAETPTRTRLRRGLLEQVNWFHIVVALLLGGGGGTGIASALGPQATPAPTDGRIVERLEGISGQLRSIDARIGRLEALHLRER